MRSFRILVPAAIAALALAASVTPSEAAPRLTLKLQNVSLFELLQRLQREYGWKLELGPNPPAKRASFDWKEASVGTVFRQVASAYSVSVRQGERPGLYRFEPATPPSGETQLREGVAVTLRRLRQEEVRTQVIGAAGSVIERTLEAQIAIRPLDGDPDSLFGLDRLRGVDDLGNEVRPVNPGLLRRQNENLPGSAPDEWLLSIPMEGVIPRSSRLQTLEGDVIFYRTARSYRFETSLSDKQTRPLQAGSLRISALAVEQNGPLLRGGYAVTWPKDVEVSSNAAAMPGMIAPWARMADGKMVPAPVSYSAIYVDENGEQSARMVFDPVSVGGPVNALVWDVTTKSEPDRRIAFRFERLPLPLAPRDWPPAAASTASMALVLKRAGSPTVGEVSIGLSPKSGSGWGPVRWTTTETDDRGIARLEGVTPGTWRLIVRFRPRGEDGMLGVEKTAKVRGGEAMTLVKGKTLTLSGDLPR